MPKRKAPERGAKEQAERFKEAAKAIGADETGAAFEKAMRAIVRAPKP
jgi:hypothetical protein